jgi:hypothetical protein
LTVDFGSFQDWQVFRGDQDFDASGDAGLASDQAGAFECKNHLVNRGRVTWKWRWMIKAA